ncbi:DUF6531 domain-containing protein [Hahella sp. NBU794]|uniref:DUF6531 domain-containing protein n=1 Tax=Hahella sp. NBU794 TaxID=3422590 RepID=UPI003D6FEEC1
MVAVISSQGLGIFNGGQALDGAGSGVIGQAKEQAIVNAATGNLIIRHQDELIVGKGLDTSVLRTYNSQGALSGSHDSSWFLGLDRRLIKLPEPPNASGSELTRVNGDGSETTYQYIAALGAYRSTDGEGAHDLVRYDKSSAQWTWTEGSSKVQDVYDASGRLLKSLDRHGNQALYTYNAKNLLSSVKDASGQTTYFEYKDKKISAIRTVQLNGQGMAFSATTVRYGYDAVGRLNKVTLDLTPEDGDIKDGKVYTTGYAYDGASQRVAQIRQSDGSSVAITYTQINGEYRVASVTDGENRVTQFSYDLSQNATHVKNALGHTITYRYDDAKRLSEVIAPPVEGQRSVTRYQYDEDGNIVRVEDAFGNSVRYQYDANGNLIEEQDALGGAIKYVYSSDNRLLLKTTYAVPDPDGDGASAPSKPMTSRFVYDANGRLRFEISAEGRVAEYRYDTAGLLTETLQFINARFDLSALPQDRSLNLSDMSQWLVSAQDKSVQRTSNRYDFRGQLLETISYSDTKFDSPSVTGAGRKLFIYDENGRLLQSSNEKGEATTFKYDGLGRLVQSVDAEKRISTALYDDLNRTVVSTAADGVVETSVFDRSGRLISIVKSAVSSETTGATRYIYDKAGRLSVIEDANGVRTYRIYDSTGRQVGCIDGLGVLAEKRFDQSGREVAEIQYQNAINTRGFVTNEGQLVSDALSLDGLRRIATGDGDRVSYKLYDEVGRKRFQIDGEGAVTEFVYDGSGRLTTSFRYLEHLDVSDPVQLTYVNVAEKVRATPIHARVENRVDKVISAPAQPYEHTYDVLTQLEYQRSDYVGMTGIGVASYRDPLQPYGYVDSAFLQQPKSQESRQAFDVIGNPEHLYPLTTSAWSDRFVDSTEVRSITSTQNGSSRRLSWNSDGWTQNFAETTDGLSGDSGYYSLQNGALKVKTVKTSGDSVVKRIDNGFAFEYAEDGKYRLEVTTGPGSTQRYFKVGLSSGSAESEHYLFFTPDALMAQYRSGGSLQNSNLGTLKDNTTYVIEFSGAESKSVISVYEKGQPASSAWKDEQAISGWENTRSFFETRGSSTLSENYVLVDNIEMHGHASGVQTEVRYRKSSGDSYKTAVANFVDGAYQVDIADVSPSEALDLIIVQEGVNGYSSKSAASSLGVGESSVSFSVHKPVINSVNGAALKNYLPSSEYDKVSTIEAVVLKNGAEVARALTIPAAHTGYNGFVNLSSKGELAAGMYQVGLTINYKDGHTVSKPVFNYDVGDTNSNIEQTLSWSAIGPSGFDYKGKSIVFEYRPLNSGDAYKTVDVKYLNGVYYATIPSAVAENYEFNLLYKDAQGELLAQGRGSFSVSADSLNTGVFEIAEDIVETHAIEGASLPHYLSKDEAARISFVRARVFDIETDTFVGQADTYPVAYSDYQGEINLTAGRLLEAGRYHIYLTKYYKDGTVEHTPKFEYQVGRQKDKISQTLTWPANVYANRSGAVHSFQYRIAGSEGDYQSASVSVKNGSYQVTLNSLKAGEYYEFRISHKTPGVKVSSAPGGERNGVGIFKANEGELIGLNARFDYADVSQQSASGFGLQGVFTKTEAASIAYVLADVFDESTGRLVSSAYTYPGAYADYAGQVNLNTEKALEHGRYRISMTIYKLDGSIGDKTCTYEMGEQVTEVRKTVFSFRAKDVPANAIAYYAVPQLGRKTFVKAEAGANNEFKLVLENAPKGAYDVKIQYRNTQGQVIGEAEVRITAEQGVARDYDIQWKGAITKQPEGQVSRVFYNKDSLVVGELDANGYLTEHRYDGAGRKVETIRYATYTGYEKVGHLENLSLEDIRPQANVSDLHAYQIYDGRGLLVGEVDGEGYLTEVVYDSSGSVLSRVRYGSAVNYQGQPLSELKIHAAESGSSRTETFSYDKLGRISSHRSMEGLLTTYVYDSTGRLIKQIAGESKSGESARSAYKRYDGFGRVIAELNGKGGALLEQAATAEQKEAVWGRHATRYTYDAAGRLIKSEGPLAEVLSEAGGKVSARQESFLFYDQAGNLRFTVNGSGEVVEQRYNVFGQVIETIKYGSRVSTLGLNGGDSSVLEKRLNSVAGEKDVHHYFQFDSLGRKVKEINALNVAESFTYDQYGNLKSVMQGARAQTGVATSVEYAYDARGNVLSQVAKSGSDIRKLSNAYDAFGRLTQSTDALGNAKHMEYDRRGQVIVTRDALGKETKTSYDAFGRIATQTDALGHKTQYVYNDLAKTIEIISPEGVRVRTESNQFGEKREIIDGVGNITRYQYDQNGALLQVEKLDSAGVSLGLESQQQYDMAGRVISTTDASGLTTIHSYDVEGRELIRTVDPEGAALSTRYKYDALGRKVVAIDAAGGETHIEYDKSGKQTRIVTDAQDGGLQLATSYQYDEGGNRVRESRGSVVNPNQKVTEYHYDGFDQLVSQVEDPDGLKVVTKFHYDSNGNVISKTDALNNESHFVYDKNGRQVYAIDPLGGVTESRYDASGRVIATVGYAKAIDVSLYLNGVSTMGAATAVQNALNQRHGVDNAKNKAHTFVYDKDGRVLFDVNNERQVVAKYYDANGRIAATVMLKKPVPASVALDRVSLSALVANVSNSEKAVSRVVYDALGRPQYEIDAKGVVTKSEYDRAGRLAAKTVFAKPVASIDKLALILKEIQPVADNGDQTQRFFYDNLGRQRFSVDALGYATEKQYDDLGNVVAQIKYGVKQSFAKGATAADIQAQLQGIARGDQRRTQFIFGSGNRLRFTIDNAGQVFESRYDDLGREVQTIRWRVPVSLEQSHTAASLPSMLGRLHKVAGQSTSFVFDVLGRKTAATDAEGHVERYVYDAKGNLTQLENKIGSVWTYEYDANGRMIKETTPKVSITQVDRSSLSETTQLTNIVKRNEYDGLGNLVASTEADGSAFARTTRYEYDSEGRQIRTYRPKSELFNQYYDRVDSSVQILDEVTYDAMGRAVVNRVTTDQSLPAADRTLSITYKVYDDRNQLIFDIDGENHVTEYAYDAFGNRRFVIRYANKLSVSGHSAGAPLSESQVRAALKASAANDRTLTTQYDKLNRAVLVKQNEVEVFDVSVSRTETFRDSPTTSTTYNGFGEIVKTSVLKSSRLGQQGWGNSFKFYDVKGRVIGEVDAGGYVTAYKYDAYDNVIEKYDYATPYAGDVSKAKDFSTLLEAMIASSSEIGEHGSDQITRFSYDSMNRLVRSAKVGVTHYSNTPSSVQTLHAFKTDLVETYEYDALGNRISITDPSGAKAYTFFDALGREVMVVESPQTLSSTDSTAVRPVTEFLRDAFGNVVKEVKHSVGFVGDISNVGDLSKALESAPQANSNDHVSHTFFDAWGKEVQKADAEGRRFNTAYDAFGNVVKEWHNLTNVDRTLAAAKWYRYDRSGNQIETRSRYGYEAERISSVQVDYNAFGEVIARGTGSHRYEYYEYDRAGRLSHSNDQDGVDKLYGYTLAGASSALFKSLSVDIRSKSLSEIVAKANWSGLDFQITKTDYAGRAIANWNTRSGDVAAVEQRLDRWGNVKEAVLAGNASNKTYFDYDAGNRMIRQRKTGIQVTGANGVTVTREVTTQHAYDYQGNLLRTIDDNGNRTHQVFSAAGQLLLTMDGNQAVTRYNYDMFGNQLSVTDAIDHVTYREYDKVGNVLVERNGKEVRRYSYDELGHRIIERDSEGMGTRYIYNARGDLIETRGINKKTADTGSNKFRYYAYEYDERGNKTMEVDGLEAKREWLFESGASRYFGRADSYKNLGGVVTKYAYNKLGLLQKETNGNGMNRTYSYYDDGKQKDIVDSGVNSKTSYRYDAVGNRVFEGFWQNGVQYKNSVIGYDSENRIVSVKDDMVEIQYQYDAVGNRRHTFAKYIKDYAPGASTANKEWKSYDYWYNYNKTNQITVSQGSLVNGKIVKTQQQGIYINYLLNGSRARSIQYDKSRKEEVTEQYLYNAENRLAQTKVNNVLVNSREYDSAGRQIKFVDYDAKSGSKKETRSTAYNDWGLQHKTVTYNKDGQRISEVRYFDVDNSDFYWYDANGNVDQYQVQTFTGTKYTNTISYLYTNKYDGYKETEVWGNSTYFQRGNSYSFYDVNGNLVRVEDKKDSGNNRSMINDAEGKILVRKQSEQNQYLFYANGKQVGMAGKAGGKETDDFDLNYTPVSEQYPSSTPSSYVVNPGDTLQTISAAVYGDASLWYVIADANGLRGVDDLQEGMPLRIPNMISNLHNTADTFKPYNPRAIIGDTTPTMPEPPPPKHGGKCGSAFMLIVAVAVAVVSAGVGLAAYGAVSASVATTIGGSLGAVAGVGAGVLAAGVVSSAITQMGSIITGQQKGLHFSWKDVAIDGISTAVGYELLGEADKARKTLSLYQAAGHAAVKSVTRQAVSMAVGRQEHFNWRALSASVLTAGVGNILGGSDLGKYTDKLNYSVGDMNFDLGGALINGAASSVANKAAYGHGKFNYMQVAADVFGNPLGAAIASPLGGKVTEWTEQAKGALFKMFSIKEHVTDLYSDPLLSASLNSGGLMDGESYDMIRRDDYDSIIAENGGSLPANWVHYQPGEDAELDEWREYYDTATEEEFYQAALDAKYQPEHLALQVSLFSETQFTREMRDGYTRWVKDVYPMDPRGPGVLGDKFGRDLMIGLVGQIAEDGGVVGDEGAAYFRDYQSLRLAGGSERASSVLEMFGEGILGALGLPKAVGVGKGAVAELALSAESQVFTMERALSRSSELRVRLFSGRVRPLTNEEYKGISATGLSRKEIDELMETTGDLYVFRGTRSDAHIPGGEGSEVWGKTPTSLDPLRATIFAVERKTSERISTSVYFGSRTDLEIEVELGMVHEGQETTTLIQLEREVFAPLKASELARRAPYKISVEQSSQILRDMGFSVPQRLSGDKTIISDTLRESPNMTAQQIAEYIRRAKLLTQ